MVDANGERYANEALPYDRFGREMAKAPERIPSWFVFDSREGGRLPAIAMPEGDPAEHLAAGTWVRADSLPELAGLIGVPADALVATVERFNGFCETGVDEDFGRGDDEYDTFFAGGTGPNKALTAVHRGAVLRRPLRALRPRHQGRPGHRRPPAGCCARTGQPHRRAVRRQQLRRVGVRQRVPGPGSPARLGDGVRLARGRATSRR